MSKTIEFRVRPVTRYIVTSYEADTADVEVEGMSRQHGEFDSQNTAYAVAYALCKAEHERLGYPPTDERVQYPHPVEYGAIGSGGLSAATRRAG